MMPTVKDDMQHLRSGYALLHDALDEFMQVYRKDNILAHAVRILGAIEDTIYQMITSRRTI